MKAMFTQFFKDIDRSVNKQKSCLTMALTLIEDTGGIMSWCWSNMSVINCQLHLFSNFHAFPEKLASYVAVESSMSTMMKVSKFHGQWCNTSIFGYESFARKAREKLSHHRQAGLFWHGGSIPAVTIFLI